MRCAAPKGPERPHPQLSALSDGGSSRRQRRAEPPEAGRSGSVERQSGRKTARRTKSARQVSFARRPSLRKPHCKDCGLAAAEFKLRHYLSFVCQACGTAHNRWQGKCEACGEWNTLAEEDGRPAPVSIRSRRKGKTFQLQSLSGKSQDAPRLASGMAELDRVTGGGFVRGSVLLVGGDPGIGKS